MTCACGCCDGVHPVTPAAIVNRPGLRAIHTRIGTQASFLETMVARLSSADYPELAGLTTRDPGDASIAVLDAWATVADVLTFYQERIANEGYLRTATERRSLVELARLVGYVPRPGVAASVFLAYTLEKDSAPATIPKGSKVNNVPGPGETMEAFETSEDLVARVEWNAIRPRLTAPQQAIHVNGLYLKGTATRLKPGDMMLAGQAGSQDHQAFRVVSVVPDETAKRTLVTLAEWIKPSDAGLVKSPFGSFRNVLDRRSLLALLAPVAQPPRGSAQLSRSIGKSFAPKSDAPLRLLTSVEPKLAGSLYAALRNAGPAVKPSLEVYAMRIEARPFGYNAPLKMNGLEENKSPKFIEWTVGEGRLAHQSRMISLDTDYEVAADTMVAIEYSEPPPPETKANEGKDEPTARRLIVLPHFDWISPETKVAFGSIRHQGLAAFGLSGKTLTLRWVGKPADATQPPGKDPLSWLTGGEDLSIVRGARVFLGSENLPLADAPITDDVAGATIELDGLYDGLTAGRWLIVEGERTDILDANDDAIPGIRATELVMLARVEQGVGQVAGMVVASEGKQDDGSLAGDTYHTTITLADSTAGGAGLAYRYKRDTVTIYANVVHATHGETRAETMGSGNAAQALQTFVLRQPPLTYVSARTPSGVASTLEVRVNDVLWHEAASLAALGPDDRKFTTKTGDDDRVAVIFGNGKRGMRLPTGRENVTARYRNGIGAKGNVGARAISLLASRPLGVKDVINPIRASGGADREGADAIRRNAPIALMALDRLLSTSDYQDFARAFGGVGKAAAWRDKGAVSVVIAGVDDAPVDESSDLFVNLKDALHRFGDPIVPLKLTVRDRLSMIVQAGVRVDPDYLWEKVEPKVRAAMLKAFSFDAQEIGARAFLARAFQAIQRVRGVTSVDIDVFDAISADGLQESPANLAGTLTLRQSIPIKPYQIAYLSPDVADTLILQELPS